MRVLLDTTVLCGALVQPNSINFKLLMLAKGPFLIPLFLKLSYMNLSVSAELV